MSSNFRLCCFNTTKNLRCTKASSKSKTLDSHKCRNSLIWSLIKSRWLQRVCKNLRHRLIFFKTRMSHYSKSFRKHLDKKNNFKKNLLSSKTKVNSTSRSSSKNVNLEFNEKRSFVNRERRNLSKKPKV